MESDRSKVKDVKGAAATASDKLPATRVEVVHDANLTPPEHAKPKLTPTYVGPTRGTNRNG